MSSNNKAGILTKFSDSTATVGSDYSTQVMEDQQERLHEQYGLPQEEEISPELLEVPPSLRNGSTITAGDNTTEDVRPT